jgi:hypothetical protein
MARLNGFDFNLFKKPLVDVAAFPSDPQVQMNIVGQFSFSLLNEGTGVIEYSFNGTTVHGDLTPGTPSQGLFFDNRRVSAIWFRMASGIACTVRVEAWSGP